MGHSRFYWYADMTVTLVTGLKRLVTPVVTLTDRCYGPGVFCCDQHSLALMPPPRRENIFNVPARRPEFACAARRCWRDEHDSSNSGPRTRRRRGRQLEPSRGTQRQMMQVGRA